MSFKIFDSNIVLTRGDTFKTKIDIFTDKKRTNKYIPVEGDRMTFAVKKTYSDPKPVILKEIPIDTCVIHLTPEDTKRLPQPSEWVYEVEMTLNNGFVDTFLKGRITLTEEVN